MNENIQYGILPRLVDDRNSVADRTCQELLLD